MRRPTVSAPPCRSPRQPRTTPAAPHVTHTVTIRPPWCDGILPWLARRTCGAPAHETGQKARRQGRIPKLGCVPRAVDERPRPVLDTQRQRRAALHIDARQVVHLCFLPLKPVCVQRAELARCAVSEAARLSGTVYMQQLTPRHRRGRDAYSVFSRRPGRSGAARPWAASSSGCGTANHPVDGARRAAAASSGVGKMCQRRSRRPASRKRPTR